MNIQEEVVDMYTQVPFPDYGDDPLETSYVKRKNYIDLVLYFKGRGYSIYQDKAVLEAGCGTGRESMYLASNGARLTAIDITERSLNVAKQEAARFDFRHNIRFMKASVLDMPFGSGTFDIVLSSGVIHHTAEPERAFSELTRVLTPGGYLILFVYNNFAHIIPNLRRKIVTTFAGNDPHKRANLAQKVFPRYLKNSNLARVYDEFGHPHKSEHSIKQVLSWFHKYRIRYESVYPKFGFRGYLRTYKQRATYMRTNQFVPLNPRLNKPTAVNQIFSNVTQLVAGCRAYSGGYRFIGVKNID